MKLDDDLCAHYLNPDFSDGFLDDTETQVYVKYPYPIHKPFKSTGVDLIHKFHEDSASYFGQLSTLYKDFQLVKGRIMNQMFNNSYATVTKGLLNFCSTEKCVAPFPCDYNPFYTTGFLESFKLNGNEYLIRPDCKNNLCITDIVKPWKNKKLNLKTKLEECVTGISKTLNDDGDTFLLLQLKNEVNLLKIDNIDDISDIKWKKNFKRVVIDSKFNRERLGVILSNTKFHLYDIETCKKLKLTDYSINSAIHVEFTNENNIALLNQNSLKIIDQRSHDYKLFEPELDDCNRLCSFKIDDNMLYLGSRHHLLRTDLRFFKSVEFCTHLLRTSPCYIDLIENRNTKVLCLSSQKVNQRVVFTGNPIGSLPFNVPNIFDALTDCQLNNDLLLRDKLQSRLQNSLCGIKLLCDNNGISLYSVNFLGEIFKQEVSDTPEKDETIPMNSLCYWINKLPEPPKTLNLTNIANLSNARFALNKRIMDERLRKFTKKSKRANLFLNHFNNVYNKNNLGNLAANFISIWAEEEDEKEPVNLVPEVAPLDKVSSWIESSYFFE